MKGRDIRFRGLPAVILAGGLGTRLRETVPGLPKPMAPVHGKPFLEHLLKKLRAGGVSRVVLCVGHLRERIEEHFSDGSRFGLDIRYSVEEPPLGTGGAIRNAKGLIRGPFLLLNGDSWLEIDYREIVDAHRRFARERGAIGTIAVRNVTDASASGGVELDTDGRIVSFREKDPGISGPCLANAGVSLFEEEILRFIPADRPSSLEAEAIPAAIGAGAPLFGFPVAGAFVDIGTPEGYRRFLDQARKDR